MERSLSDITISSFLFFQTPKQSSTPPGARPVFTFIPRAPEHLLYVPTYTQSYAGIIWEGKERIIAGGVGRGVEKIFLTAGSEFVPQGDLSSPFSRRLLPRLYLLSFMPPPHLTHGYGRREENAVASLQQKFDFGTQEKSESLFFLPLSSRGIWETADRKKKNRGHESFPFVAEIKFRSRCFSKPKMRLCGGKQLMVLGGVT